MIDIFGLPGPMEGDRVAMARVRGAMSAFLHSFGAVHSLLRASDAWLTGFDPEFSAALGSAGWIGMTWPREYGGGERTEFERFAAIEELLRSGAPVAAHWFADRQVGPALLRVGTEEQRQRFLPGMAAGDIYFAIGMSEPESGSDLASVRTTARRDDGGWVLSGTKTWTSNAHRCHYLVVLCRTGDRSDAGGGLTQLLVSARASGLDIRPIPSLGGEAHFCEVFFDEVFVPDTDVLGTVGGGWAQVLTELSYERGGPERYLSPMPLLLSWLEGAEGFDEAASADAGRALAELWSVREASLRVARARGDNFDQAIGAALVKDVGTRLEQELVGVVRRHVSSEAMDDTLFTDLHRAVLHAPGFTLRGGTTEILRSIVARALLEP